MGREIRHVPAGWKHPKDEHGRYIAMVEHFRCTAGEIADGIEEGWLMDTPPHYGQVVMPQWTDAERTHMQMYERTSEGTPISPVMAGEEELARWLADNNASAFGDETATYGQWLATIRAGGAVSCIIQNGQVTSGVAFHAGEDEAGDTDD